MTLSVVIVSAGGNPTALVESPAVPAELRAAVGAYILGTSIVEAEQVGFLGEAAGADLRMDMAGDELCVNALRAAATLAFSRHRTQTSWSIATSGYHCPVQCRVTADGDQYDCTIVLPLDARRAVIAPDLQLTVLGEIAHFTHRVAVLPDAATSEATAAEVRQRPEVEAIPAVGYIPFTQSGDDLTIAPLIYTRSLDASVRETACGSGTIAAALHAASPATSVLRVTQPSGSVYRVSLAASGTGQIATLASPMSIVAQRTIEVPSSLVA